MSELIRYSVVDTVNAKRAMGVNDEQIAYVLNLSPSQVRAIPFPRPNVSRTKAVQQMQLQVALQQLMPAVEKGDRDAMLTMLKVQQRQSSLLGLDAPKEVINHNYNSDVEVEGMTMDQIKDMPTEALKAIVLRKAAQGAINLQPDGAGGFSDPSAPAPDSPEASVQGAQ